MYDAPHLSMACFQHGQSSVRRASPAEAHVVHDLILKGQWIRAAHLPPSRSGAARFYGTVTSTMPLLAPIVQLRTLEHAPSQGSVYAPPMGTARSRVALGL